MATKNSFVETVSQIASDGVQKGIFHLYTEDEKLTGNKLHLKNKEVINFGSCSYLGLEFDRRMKDSAIRAIENYGTQFSESRSYVSTSHYLVLEKLLNKLFDAHAVVTPTTTLGHISTIPVLIENDDAIILDHQVHNSIHIAVSMVKSKGVHIEMVRHNRMDLLEEKIKSLRLKHKKIWYMADGIYSMYGDVSPVKEVISLMNKYPELYYYVDDAHGMSCFGKHGRGYVLDQSPIHERMVVGISLNKAFASGGGAMLFPSGEMANKVRSCGGPMITSGPMQPAALGAAIAAATIHLSDEIYQMQEDLQENIKYANLMIQKYGLPLVADTPSPVFFIGVSLPKLGYNMVKRMMNEGYYLNLGIFPAVPMKNTGIRFTITRLHTFRQIEDMIAAMAQQLPLAMLEENITWEQICQAFKLKTPQEKMIEESLNLIINQSELKIERHTSITKIDKQEWDILLGARGSFNYDGLCFLEKTFTNSFLAEDNWDFDYILIRDINNKPVLATFLTTTLLKDDMLSPESISAQIELDRKNNPYYLTSKVIMMGSLITEGEHLFIDRNSDQWKEALIKLFEIINELQEKYDASNIMLRDFKTGDAELDAFFIENGFIKVSMPDNHLIAIDWESDEEYEMKLSSRSRKHLRQDILKHSPKYELSVSKDPTSQEIAVWYDLYLNVKNNSLELNTFKLPYRFFENIAHDKNWEVLTLKLKNEFDKKNETSPVAVMFSYFAEGNSNFMLIGLDYTFQKEYGCYRQALYQNIQRAKELNCKNVHLGFAASFEKRKLGASIIPTVAYMQAKDHYNMSVIENMSIIEIKTH
ncbi:MAG: hypothetical protein A3F72_13360 [Bacteroidetes bacterium RIFCSPLOWO2_12_FULL_35_15]|nr:MAG: hypothetical protein A3F72_13360 [Bacteroidetes bacterium RIFCSPLOWO2_12_FULL_35_15]